MSKVFQMLGGSCGSIKLASIEITTPPTKTAYKAGEQFSTAGMVVKATYSNGATLIATGVSVEPSGGLEAGRTSVTIRYTEGGVSCTATQAVTVTKTNVTVPSQSGSLTYSGSSQSPAWYNYDTAKMTLGGTTSGTNAGTYSAKFTLKDTALYQWADGTTAPKTVSWKIGKADGSLTLSKTEKGLPLAVANTKEKGKVVCNWVGGAAESDQAVLTLTFTNAATKSYTFKVSGAKVTDKNYETTKIADFPIRIYVACNGKNCPSKSYKDVDQTQWYHNAVDYVLGNDLMKGTGKTTFSPDATLTRGMVVTVLGRAAGVKTSDYTGTSFSDVKAGSWYAPYVQWASKQGLVKGYEDGTFKPEQNVTREEMVTMLFRCWQSEGNTWKTDVAALNAYKDSAKVSSWALPAMRWAAANGVVNGVGDSMLEPQGQATRAQFAKIIMVYLENLA